MRAGTIFLLTFIILVLIFNEGFAGESIDYSYYYNFKYATNASGAWETYKIDRWDTGYDYYEEDLAPTSIAVDSTCYIHIIYTFWDALLYTSNVSGKWERISLGTVAKWRVSRL